MVLGALELMSKKKYVKYIIICVMIIVFFIGLSIINKYYWRVKCEQTMELFGTALINKDIELMDELLAQDCSMFTTEGRERKYYYQRGVIEEIWKTTDFEFTSYNFAPLGWSSKSLSALYSIEMRVLDANKDEYSVIITVTISRENIFDAVITHTNCGYTKNPRSWEYPIEHY